jgi:hypothetical protein
MSKLFVRERRQIGAGMGEPRLRIVASEGLDMRIYVPHMRRVELEQLATAAGAEIVYLSRGDQEGGPEGGRHPGRGRHLGSGRGRGQGRGRRLSEGQGQGPGSQMQDLD